jgi:hypothetical protein
MPSKCSVDCQLHAKFEEAHTRLERLDHLEILFLRLRADLPLLEAERYRFLTSRIRRVRRLERRTATRINRITWILSFNGPGCSRCVANGEEFEWEKWKTLCYEYKFCNNQIYFLVRSYMLKGTNIKWIGICHQHRHTGPRMFFSLRTEIYL